MGALRSLLPLVVLFVCLGVGGWIGYQIYLFANELANRGVRKMEKKNVSFTKDGMKVGVKEVRAEDYADRTQRMLVNTWNNASFPGYKSRLWGNGPEVKPELSKRPSSTAAKK